MRWSAATVAIARCKRVSTESAARSVERVGLPWTCSENRAPKAESKPLGRYTKHAGETHDTESLLQCQNTMLFLVFVIFVSFVLVRLVVYFEALRAACVMTVRIGRTLQS